MALTSEGGVEVREELEMSSRELGDEEMAEALVLRHIRFGWTALLFFLSLGFVLEMMHGLKLGWYLNAGEETRRLLLTLAHAHGVLLALVNLAFASTLKLLPNFSGQGRRIGSNCLIGATIAMPMGFLMGGLVTYGGDPGLGVALVPVAAVLLFVGVAAIAHSVLRHR